MPEIKEQKKSFFAQMEEKILKFWQENKIFEKSVELRPKTKEFVFYEGPPTANGLPGIHHVLARAFKDIICRYKTMKGYRVERKAGWDTHGLPVEIQVEKELKIFSKPEIEKLGIEKFNEKCRENVWYYKDEWEKLTRRIAFWLDLEHPYITYTNEYIESVWWILSQIYRKGLLYEGYKVLPYCLRCGTGLSSHEVALGYKKIKEDSIYIKFKVKPGQKIAGKKVDENTYFLVWTTTAWTLPGNVALAINNEIIYCKIKNQKTCPELAEGSKIKNIDKNSENNDKSNEYLVLAKDRLQPVLGDNYKILEEFRGKDLVGLEYEQLFDFVKPVKPAFRIVAGDFVTTQDGSGIVHIAPAFGADDMKAKEENDLPILITVDTEGKFAREITPWAGKSVISQETNKEIIKEIAARKLLFKSQLFEHDYPFCWRCDTKLIYYVKKSWFIRMTDPEIKKALVENNEKINWIPGYIKEGRMGEWLREVKDWALSRERYWGTPLPIWRCQSSTLRQAQGDKKNVMVSSVYTEFIEVSHNIKKNCGNIKIIGSIAELEKLGGKKLKDLHRPYIDEIVFKCEKCGGEMRRVTDVIDCWFDSGAMPFAQWHYPFENSKLIDENKKFPADYISEAIDQTRGWFYTLLAISTLLGKGPAYKNVITYGHVLDAKGQKMSKSKGNIVDPWYVADNWGIDILRWYFYAVGAPGEPKRFNFKDLDEIRNRFFRTYWNSFLFFKTYARDHPPPTIHHALKNLLDKWIISRLNETILKVTKYLDSYDVMHAARIIGDFVDDLSNWYVRRSRERFKTKESEAIFTLSLVLKEVSKLTAPFIPFISEEIYQQLVSDTEKKENIPESIHLHLWPKADKKAVDEKLDKEMKSVREIVTLGLKLRAETGVKVRQPLLQLKVKSEKARPELIEGLKVNKELVNLIKDELNIKEVIFVDEIKEEVGWISETDGVITVALNTKITKALKEEGMVREFVRALQEARKKLKLTPSDFIDLGYKPSGLIDKIFAKWGKDIKKKTIIKNIVSYKKEDKFDLEKEILIDEEKVWIGIKINKNKK